MYTEKTYENADEVMLESIKASLEELTRLIARKELGITHRAALAAYANQLNTSAQRFYLLSELQNSVY